MAEGAVALTEYEKVKDRLKSEQVRICDAHADALQIIPPEHLNNALKAANYLAHGGTTAALAADCASFVEYGLASGIRIACSARPYRGWP
jgi:hypothetical protein